MTKAYSKTPGYKHYEVTKTYRLWAPSKEEALQATENGEFWLMTKSVRELKSEEGGKVFGEIVKTIKEQLGVK